MADQTVVSYTDLSRIVSAVNAIRDETAQITQEVNTVNNNIAVVYNGLQDLSERFEKMIIEQRQAAALQRALTEIIRVRQELEQKFGNYKIVRDTMIGVLQATDKKLVTQSTISRVSEELMLSTPNYWLAPVLVAVSAWIANNRDLANRAIAEAIKRDEEKTALTMALICRRNERQTACYEWLALYFSKQSAWNMKRSIVTYIDAYVSGVFGPDEDDMCRDYIKKWMNELLRDGDEFKRKQIEEWEMFYMSFCRDTSSEYPLLAKNADEFPRINACIQRVEAGPQIKGKIKDIIDAPIDREALIEKIDMELMNLVTKYDDNEAPLREEEERLQLIKDNHGDEELVDKIIEYRKNAKSQSDQPVNLAERLAETVKSEDTENAAARKTAVAFLSGYMSEGFINFLKEKKADFPEKINLNVDGSKLAIKDSGDAAPAKAAFEKEMNAKRQTALSKVKKGGLILCIVAFIGLLILGAVLAFGAKNGFGYALMVFGVILGIVALVIFNSNKKKKAAINKEYDQRITTGKSLIDNATTQWVSAKRSVEEFYAIPDGSNFAVMEVGQNG